MQPTDRRGFLRRLGLAALVVSPLGRAAVRTAPSAPPSVAEVKEAVFLNGFRNARRSDLSASYGGLCAPVSPYYELELRNLASRPVRDALPTFHLVRDA